MEFLPGTMKIANAVCECISILMAAALPIAAALLLKKKTNGKMRTILFGALGFFVSALVLEQVAHLFFLALDTPMSRFCHAHAWAYGLYGCLAAGIFEETGRYVMYRTALKNDRGPSVPLLYGIGHGGCESLLVGALSMACIFFMGIKINMLGSAVALKDMAPEMLDSFLKTYEPLFSGSPYILLAGGFERVSAMMLHMAMSIVVYLAASQKKFRLLYPAAIGMHAVFDIPAVLFQKNVITSIAVIEVLIFAAGAVALYLAVRFALPATAQQKSVE